MKNQLILSFLTLFLSVGIYAQFDRDSLLFRGVVMEGDSLFVLPYAKYVVNNDQGYMTNDKGQFSFWAQNGDIVRFSYVGFKSLYVQINDSLANRNFLMGVFLSKDTIELSEVVILPQITNPNAAARNMPLLRTPEETVGQHNVDVSAYQAKTQPVTEWDAEMNQKNFIQARSNDVAYRGQIQPTQMIGISNVSVQQALTRAKIEKLKEPKKVFISQAEWEFLITSYQEKMNSGMLKNLK